MMMRTKVSKDAEQFKLGEHHYVGRRVLRLESSRVVGGPTVLSVWTDIAASVKLNGGEPVKQVLFRLDYGKGDVFVDPSILTPFPSEPIPEPSK